MSEHCRLDVARIAGTQTTTQSTNGGSCFMQESTHIAVGATRVSRKQASCAVTGIELTLLRILSQ